ncbi:hypothetical protein PHSC3_000542 [Chlamydiales bacterium STE3]|nr:hypothetical protein PHSC3_000542 [Chlamydiales bacterium STE3]
MADVMCPCNSGNPYRFCCEPLHQEQMAENALKLMRSRYSAYALNLSDYIIATTHPASSHYSENKFAWKRSISQFSKNSTFKHLEILNFKERERVAVVIFTAHLMQNGQDATFSERSYFEKWRNQWTYLSGHVVQGDANHLHINEKVNVLPLAYYGDAILRRKAEPIQEISNDIRKLVEEMIATMDACDGMGLAAPQVHQSLQLFIMRAPSSNGENQEEIHVFINPEMISFSQNTWKAPEGCLSIPGLRTEVERPHEITVAYTTLEGERVTKQFKGWEAKIIMHENDHLHGILFIDRLAPNEKRRVEVFLRNLERRLQTDKGHKG